MRDFDYRTPGAYFFTICLKDRRPLFSRVQDGRLVHNAIGEMVLDIWNKTSLQFPNVETDAFVLMPDHAHGIWLLGADGFDLSPSSFIRVIRWFKSETTIAYGKGVTSQGWPRYQGKLWQQDYIERYLRNDFALEQKRAYIEGNPGRWEEELDQARLPNGI